MSSFSITPGPNGGSFDEWKRLLFQCVREPLLLIDPSGRLLDANPEGTDWIFRYLSPGNATDSDNWESFHFSRTDAVPIWKSVIEK
ncbi:MAG: hypothetical protein HGA26_08995, partial [Chlorobiaceae bacterium]|nr:hypothetical protein [Chlorobiaceae bacterium]